MAAARAARAGRRRPALRERLHAPRELGPRRRRRRRSRRAHHAGRARVPRARPAPGIPPDAAHAAGVRAAAARARLHRRHRGGRDGGRPAAASGSRRGPADAIALAPEFDEEWLDVFRDVERRWPPEQDPGARWVLGSGTSPRRFALARVDGEPAATGYGRLEDDWLYIACVATFPERRRLGLARAVSERLFAWGVAATARAARSCRRRRKTPPRRRFTSSSASARATSIATSFRALTNTPFRASQGPGTCCRCRSQTPPGSAAGTPGGLW